MIVELENDVVFDEAVQPLCVPNSLDSLLYDMFPLTGSGSPYVNCYTAGWGDDGIGWLFNAYCCLRKLFTMTL